MGVSRNGINITTLEPQQRTTANLKSAPQQPAIQVSEPP
ncbi:unnamed protein product [Echinostoma caproni]|uniref:Uncharacterized protein n=1 Tax=Echinostoma caproni TaxID=27848 RepID=A0A3P8GY74_9TREM|nr:unnamed protein product [Echinostoma caproni]